MQFSFIVLLSLYIKLWFSSSKSVWQEGLICNTLLIKRVKSISYIKAFIYSLSDAIFFCNDACAKQSIVRCCDKAMTMERQRKMIRQSIATSLSHYRIIAIVLSRHRAIGSFCHRTIVITLSRHRIIISSSSLHCYRYVIWPYSDSIRDHFVNQFA